MKHYHLKLFVPAGVIALGLFLYTGYLQAGRLTWIDWLAVAGAAVVGSIVFVVSARTVAVREASGASASGTTRRQWWPWLVFIGLTIFATPRMVRDLHRGFQASRRRSAMAEARAELAGSARVLRTAAGRPDATGYVPAHSEAGGFFVHMPNVFNEMSTTFHLHGQDVTAVGVSSVLAGMRFVVLAVDEGYGKDVDAPKTICQRLLRVEDSELIEERLFDGRHPLFLIRVKLRDSEGFVQTIFAERQTYVLMADGPQITDTLRETAKVFFNSFAILSSEPNELAGTALPERMGVDR